MDKRFWAVIAAIALIFVGIIIANKKSADAPGATNTKTSSTQATNHVKGGNAKNVTLVEYGDFQCPVCGLYEPTVEEVYNKYKADIKFQFRNFPLQQIHQNAFAAARAAEAASNQGKFWEMHDLLFDNQQSWSTSATPQTFFEQYAQSLSLDMTKYKADFASEATKNTINADSNEAEKLGVNSTPTYFLNGKKLENSQVTDENNRPLPEKFSALIDQAIKDANK